MPTGKRIEQYYDWSWLSGTATITATFDRKTGNVVAVNCYVAEDEGANPFNCLTVGGLSAGTVENQVVDKLGTPDRTSYDTASPTKRLYYDHLGLKFTLAKQEAYMIQKTAAPDAGRFWWWLGHGRP